MVREHFQRVWGVGVVSVGLAVFMRLSVRTRGKKAGRAEAGTLNGDCPGGQGQGI